jgi:type II secretory pathway pseudopilin PulG
MEMMVAVTVIGVLMGMAIPRFGKAIEQAKADFAVANLRAIWSAQRLYWLENHSYAEHLTNTTPSGLYELGLLDAGIINPSGDYVFSITAADDDTFQAVATRADGTAWAGEFVIDETGVVTGNVSATGETTITSGLQ